jgi:hypothetical protein
LGHADSWLFFKWKKLCKDAQVINVKPRRVHTISDALVNQRQRQNRLLKQSLGVGSVVLIALFLLGAKANEERAKFSEIDVERINIVNANGKVEMVLANRMRLPKAVINDKQVADDRQKPGIIFYNAAGDESGGLFFEGKLDANGKPNAGMHLSRDRFGGDQQLALGHYESGGFMETGLNVYDRGLAKDYGALFEAMQKAPVGAEKDLLKKKWMDAGGAQTTRLFVGKTRSQSSAVILADTKGAPRIMMLVSPDGQPMLNFMDEKGQVIQSLPQPAKDTK